MDVSRSTRLVALVAGAVFVGFGLWAFIDARSFYDQLATFPPYNRHLLHDIGAFQIGIGASLLLAAAWRDALSAALGGAGLGGVFHAAAHVWDRDLGGKATDPWFFALLAVVLVGAALVRRRATGTT